MTSLLQPIMMCSWMHRASSVLGVCLEKAPPTAWAVKGRMGFNRC